MTPRVVTVVGYDGSFDPAALARQPAGATPARLLAGIRATLSQAAPGATITFVADRTGRPMYVAGGP